MIIRKADAGPAAPNCPIRPLHPLGPESVLIASNIHPKQVIVLDLLGGLDLETDRVRSAPPRDPLGRARALSEALFEHAPRGDAAGDLQSASLSALASSGLPLAVFPRRHGGAGLLDRGQSAQLAGVLRLLGAGDLSIGRLFEGHVNAVALVERYGTDSQLDSLATAVMEGALSAVWNAEGRRPLKAVSENGFWHLTGEKILASGAGLISHPIVTPRTPEGVIMLIAEDLGAERIDLSSWTPQGMRGSATGTVDLSGLSFAGGSEIGDADDYQRQPAFSGGAWRFCAVHLGAAERLLDLFRAQLRARGRAGDPYQKQRVAAATAACITARLWIDRAATLVAAQEGEPNEIVAFVNLTRMVTERACLDVIEAVQRGVGLGAFMRPDPIERIARDLATYLRQPVPDAAMADAAAAVLASETQTFDLWES